MNKQLSLQGALGKIIPILALLFTPLLVPAQEWQLSTLHSFGNPTASARYPSDLILANDSKLYGTCRVGGENVGGFVFRMDRNGRNFESIRNFLNVISNANGFTPVGGVLQADDGRLYGTTIDGGTNNGGTIYTLNTDGSNFREIHQFDLSDSEPEFLTEGADGKLYGNTQYGGDFESGSVFRINKDGSSYEVIHQFDSDSGEGAFPEAPLLQGSDGVLYGTTSGNWDTGPEQGPGAIFKLNPDGTGFQFIHTVNTNDGTVFFFRLTEGRDGALYGTTYVGPTDNGGVVFKIHKDGTGYRVLYNFSLNNLSAPVVPFGPFFSNAEGLLYGVTKYGGPGRGVWGTLFSIDETGNAFRVLNSLGSGPYDARFPVGALVPDGKGTFFGESLGGGLSGEGTVLQYSSTGQHQILHNFNSSGGDGALPDSRLTLGTNGSLYGTTQKGGRFGGGTVYQVNPDGTGYRVLLNLSDQPVAIVADASNNNFYLTTSKPGLGVLYRMTSSGKLKVLHRFHGGIKDGAAPGAPVVASDGRLYGLTGNGGTNGGGVLYGVDKNGKNYKILYNLEPPFGLGNLPLMEGSDGMLYGGSVGFAALKVPGKIFKIAKDGTAFTFLHIFNTSDPGGVYPSGPMLEASDGMIYGTTEDPFDDSTSPIVYRMDKDGNNFQVLYTFTNNHGVISSLVEGSDGAVYGISTDDGSVFRIQKDTLSFTIIAHLTPTLEPADTQSGLIRLANGALCGTVTEGGDMNIGQAFELLPP